MAVSIDRWAPGEPKPQSRRRVPLACGSDASRDSRAFRSSTSRTDRSDSGLALARTPARKLQSEADPCREWRRSHSQPGVDALQPHDAPRFAATRALWVWLACGVVLTLTCPPIAAAQTLLGALPLWLVGLPAVSLAVVAMGSAGR